MTVTKDVMYQRTSALVNELVEQGQFFERGEITSDAFTAAVNHYVRRFIEQSASQASALVTAPSDELRADLWALILRHKLDKFHGFVDNAIDAFLAALAAPAPAPQQPTDMQAKQAEFAGMHDFLNWNRAQPEPLVKIACEYGVFSKAVALYRAALAGAAPTQAPATSRPGCAYPHCTCDPDSFDAPACATPTEAVQGKENQQ